MLAWVTDNLAVGAAPMSLDQLDFLRDQGINAILNLCAEFTDLHRIEAEHGFDVHYLPVRDEEAPDLEKLELALAWLDEAVYLDKKAYIHCRHGIGRTGTVLNAYLLRRGLGHKKAGKIIKGLRSQPANFEQWWTVRKYGRKSGRLTIREPSLEFRQAVDLGPFFQDYQSLLAEAEAATAAHPSPSGRCGQDHAACCRAPVTLGLMESVSLSRALNREMSADQRLRIIERASGSSPALCVFDPSGEHDNTAPAQGERNDLCPLSDQEACLLYKHRPLLCRTSDLPAETAAGLWKTTLGPGLGRLSKELHMALAAEFPPENELEFLLRDVVSGKYVQAFFNTMKNIFRNNAS